MDKREKPMKERQDHIEGEEEPQTAPLEVEVKKSLIERTLYGYVKKFFSQGYSRLTERQFAPYFYYTVIILAASIISSVVFSLGTSQNDLIVKFLILLCLLTGLALILGGFIGGLTQNRKTLNILTVSLMVLALLFSLLSLQIFPNFFIPNYNNLILQWLKILFFLAYVIISSISLFSIIWNFQTSFAYKFISYGKSDNRMLFQGILRLGAIVSLPMYLYMALQGSLDAMILAGFGIIISMILILRFYRLPKFYKRDSFDIKLPKIAWMNFNQILGFYNLYLVYRLSQSFNTGGNISNLTTNLLLLAINTFFIMNTLSKKVDNIADEDDVQKMFVFQRDTGFLMWLKKKVSEKGLILSILGIAMGYHAVYLDSYLNSPIVLIKALSDPNRVTPLNVTYNRTFLGIALLWITISLIIYRVNPKFRSMTINRYSARHILRMFADMFRISEDGKAGVVLEAYENSMKKVEDKMNKIGRQVKGRWNNFFSLGDNSEETNDGD